VKIHYVPTLLQLGSTVALLLLAGGLLLKARAVRRTARSFRSRAVPVAATVVGLEAKDLGLGSEPDTRYFPRVSFVPEGATEPIEAQTLTDVPSPPPRVGDEIEVAYDPERPTRVDVAATQDAAEGAGRSWLPISALVAVVAVGVAAAWLLLEILVGAR